MHQGQVDSLSESIALRAAKVGTELKIPLADSVILTTAHTYGAVPWTQGTHFKDIEVVQYIEKT
jgi:hypothetical protein